jgi:hypothetical protein
LTALLDGSNIPSYAGLTMDFGKGMDAALAEMYREAIRKHQIMHCAYSRDSEAYRALTEAIAKFQQSLAYLKTKNQT